jgi:hypothetical protein
MATRIAALASLLALHRAPADRLNTRSQLREMEVHGIAA